MSGMNGLGLGIWQLMRCGALNPDILPRTQGTVQIIEPPAAGGDGGPDAYNLIGGATTNVALAVTDSPDIYFIKGGLPIWIDAHETPDIVSITGDVTFIAQVTYTELPDTALITGDIGTTSLFQVQNNFLRSVITSNGNPLIGIR